MISKILFTGDIARPLSQKGNIEFLFNLLQKTLFHVTGICPEVLSEPIEHLTLEDWAFTHGKGPYSDDDIIGPIDLTTRVVVIGFELSSKQIYNLKLQNVPFVNIQIAPVRFLSDLCFSIETSFYVDQKWLITDVEIRSAVDYVKSCYSKKNVINLTDNSVLVVGQWEHDRSVVKEDGTGFYKLGDFKQQIETYAGDNCLLYKEHPYWPSFDSFCEMFSSAINVSEINIYYLLCNPSVKSVIGISSSVLIEATHFDKKVLRLHPITNPNLMISGANLMSPYFWSHLLLGTDKSFLRKAIGSWWGYEF